MTEAEEKARDYVIKLQETGFTCFSCFNCKWAQDEAEPLKGFRTGVPEWEFFDRVEAAYKDGYEQAKKEDAEQIEKQKEINKDYVDEAETLKGQIEKMKNCMNCGKTLCNCHGCDSTHSRWELWER